MAMAMAAIAQISESCIAKKHPTCSRWYQETQMVCIMNIAKPAYDADMKVKADMKKADSSRAQHAVQSKKEHMH